MIPILKSDSWCLVFSRLCDFGARKPIPELTAGLTRPLFSTNSKINTWERRIRASFEASAIEFSAHGLVFRVIATRSNERGQIEMSLSHPTVQHDKNKHDEKCCAVFTI